MNISTAAGVKRRRGGRASQPEDEINAAELKLGPEFKLEQIDNHGNETKLITLNLSEARILIRAALKERTEMVQGINGMDAEEKEKLTADLDPDDETLARMATAPGANEVLRKTLDYLSTFARFKDAETCTAAETLLKSEENAVLHPFEVAQLGSLACEDIDEAVTLIPSLNDKKDEIDLQRILDELNRLETNFP
ncbi:DEKNAAC102589 [Brettanomyces naardenensis]|uniref:DEKNAAC102589 n=1 Tax=Brettanomyces naardenensis TaxID=13370 RepID=A0A448YKE1_BRENA|nr:DEKNAAC102589 [Brettanomyces naardenensis]